MSDTVIKFDFEDERLRDILTSILSGLVYKDTFQREYFSEILEMTFKYIKLEEMNMEFFVLFYILDNMRKIKSATKNYIPKLTKDTLELALTNNVPKMVVDDLIGMREWLDANGLKSNLNIEENFNTACVKLYQLTIELYENALEMDKSSENVLSLEPVLKDIMLNNASESVTRTLSRILFSGCKVGRKIYKGNVAWLEYNTKVIAELNRRFNEDEESDATTLTDAQSGHRLIEKAKSLMIPLANYGMPDIDDRTPMLRHRLVVLAANPNVGKTTIAIDLAVKLLLENRKVAFLCGESDKSKIFLKIVSNYIFRKYGFFVTAEHIIGQIPLSDDLRRQTDIAISLLSKSGLLTLSSDINYDSVYQDLKVLYDSCHFDGIFIDHSLSLAGGARLTKNEKVTNLAIGCRQFKRNFDVFICICSHLSSEAKKQVAAGHLVNCDGVCAESTALDKEADEIFLFCKNEKLDKANLLEMQNIKRRDGKVISIRLYLRKLFNVSAFDFRVQDQSSRVGLEVTHEQALDAIKNAFDDEDNDLDNEDF